MAVGSGQPSVVRSGQPMVVGSLQASAVRLGQSRRETKIDELNDFGATWWEWNSVQRETSWLTNQNGRRQYGNDIAKVDTEFILRKSTCKSMRRTDWIYTRQTERQHCNPKSRSAYKHWRSLPQILGSRLRTPICDCNCYCGCQKRKTPMTIRSYKWILWWWLLDILFPGAR